MAYQVKSPGKFITMNFEPEVKRHPSIAMWLLYVLSALAIRNLNNMSSRYTRLFISPWNILKIYNK
jgi:hypothetical protein